MKRILRTAASLGLIAGLALTSSCLFRVNDHHGNRDRDGRHDHDDGHDHDHDHDNDHDHDHDGDHDRN